MKEIFTISAEHLIICDGSVVYAKWDPYNKFYKCTILGVDGLEFYPSCYEDLVPTAEKVIGNHLK